MTEEGEEGKGKGLTATLDRVFEFTETIVYAVVALILISGAVVLVVQAVTDFVSELSHDVVHAATSLLGTLLLVFVFVELLAAVRTTMRERQLIAEPFLLVGVIASIKEIVVIASEEQQKEPFEVFRNSMIEIGALSGVVLVLAISALLLRRREREPQETDH